MLGDFFILGNLLTKEVQDPTTQKNVQQPWALLLLFVSIYPPFVTLYILCDSASVVCSTNGYKGMLALTGYNV